MSDPVFINNKTNNTSEIHDARIYHFVDPIDDMSQIALFEAILRKNIYEPYYKDESPIPTVITCPKLSRDLSAIMKQLANQLYQFDSSNAESAKPPILIITNVVASDEVIMDDIANLCGCKSIRKYIDPNVYKSDVEKGIAPTVDTIADFAGRAELVVADSKKTKFINPLHMSGDNNDAEYTAMLNFLETEIEQTKLKGETSGLGLLKKRLSALKSNMVDYLVGGITISDRDMKKDLIEDAIKNCKSASLYGVGYAANFEGLYNSFKVLNEYKKTDREDIYIDIASVIFKSYIEASEILYGTIELNNNIVIDNIFNSMINGHPYNISEGYFDLYEGENVLCSIRLDINILKDVSKIISTMLTANQCLLQASHLNVY
jgi:hypothetical protein